MLGGDFIFKGGVLLISAFFVGCAAFQDGDQGRRMIELPQLLNLEVSIRTNGILGMPSVEYAFMADDRLPREIVELPFDSKTLNSGYLRYTRTLYTGDGKTETSWTIRWGNKNDRDPWKGSFGNAVPFPGPVYATVDLEFVLGSEVKWAKTVTSPKLQICYGDESYKCTFSRF